MPCARCARISISRAVSPSEGPPGDLSGGVGRIRWRRRRFSALLVGPAGEAGDQLHGELLVQRGLAVQGPSHGVHQLLLGGVLEDVTGGAGLYRLEEVVGVVVGGHDEHAGSGKLRLDPARGLQPVHLGHAHVHQDQVGTQLPAEFDGLPAVGRLADHLQALFAGEHALVA
ncbi:MAG TPA: hypothetical protein VGV91_12745, partial [Rubrobacter sp.]|nr:hypothetical protein [Rubrobacter sp.]